MLNLETRHDGGQFLRAGGILLGHPVHLGHRLIDLINTLGLLLGSSGNLSPISFTTFLELALTY